MLNEQILPAWFDEATDEAVQSLVNGQDNRSYRKQSYDSFAVERLRIFDKTKKLLPLEYNPAQADVMSKLTGRDLILKARQLGMSTAIQGAMYQEVVTGTATTMTLAHDDDGTKTLRRMADRFHRNDPLAPKRGAANDRLSTYPEFDSEALIATAGNRSSGRSTTLTHLHGSEVAFWPDAESIVAGAIQAGNPKVVLESTPNGAQGYFYQLCMEALDGNSPWTLHFYPWWWDEGYQIPLLDSEAIEYTGEELALVEKYDLTPEQIKWRRTKQGELKHLFIQEYPEDPISCFLMSGNGYFGDMTDVFTAPMSPVYDQGHRYVAGLDFAQTVDFLSCRVLDGTVNAEVANIRINRMPWKEMRRQVVDLCRKWNVQVLVAENNSMGSTNIEALRDELHEAGCKANLVPFDTTNTSKYQIMGNLHAALHDDKYGLKLQDIPVHRHELMAFAAVQLPSGVWKLAAPDGEHDDTVISLALAYYAVGQAPQATQIPFTGLYASRNRNQRDRRREMPR